MEKFNEKAIEVESSSHLEEASSLNGKMAGAELTIRAKDGANLEHSLSPWEAVKAYPMAIFWALLVSMCVIMEGYDTILIGNFYAYPTFAAKYGMYFSGQSLTHLEYDSKRTYELPSQKHLFWNSLDPLNSTHLSSLLNDH